MVTTERLSRKEVQKARFIFWMLWTASISMPISVIAYLALWSWWASPVIMTVSTVIGFNYCEWLIKRRQWRAVNTVVLCECGHTELDHGATYDMDRACYHGKESISRSCRCGDYAPRFWRMSERT